MDDLKLVCVYKFKRRGTWYLRFPGNRRLSLHTSDAVKAEQRRREEEHNYRLEMEKPRSSTVVPIRLSEFIRVYLYHKTGQGRASETLHAYTAALNNFGTILARDYFVHEITPLMIEEFEASRRREGTMKKKGKNKGQRRPPPSEKTIRNELIVLSTALAWGKKRRYLLDNPMDGYELPKPAKYPPRYLRDEDYRNLMAAIIDEDFKDVVRFYLLTGCRRGEGIALRASEHLDLARKVIRIPQLKQKNFKILPITPDLMAVLNRLILRAKGSDQLIRYHEDVLTSKFREYARAAGLPKGSSFHVLRHTFGTWLGALGANFSELQELMGHGDPDSTKIYVHAYNRNLDGTLSKLHLPTN